MMMYLPGSHQTVIFGLAKKKTAKFQPLRSPTRIQVALHSEI